MADRIRFHFDEQMDPDIAEALRRQGIDVTTTQEEGFSGHEDAAHFEFVRRTGRILVTADADFLRIASTNTQHPGIVFCHRTKHSLGEVARFLILLYEVDAPDAMAGRVEYL